MSKRKFTEESKNLREWFKTNIPPIVPIMHFRLYSKNNDQSPSKWHDFEKEYQMIFDRIDWPHFISFFLLNSQYLDKNCYHQFLLKTIASKFQIKDALEILYEARNILKNEIRDIKLEIEKARSQLFTDGIEIIFISSFDFEDDSEDDTTNEEKKIISEIAILKVEWSNKIHIWFPNIIKKEIETLLILSLFNTKTKQPQFPNCYFYKLPRDIKYEIFKFISC